MTRSNRKSSARLLRTANSCVEPLEQRCLLSSTPSGFTPSQIAQAYGINAIKFGSIVGNGAGQTIAIVNAYDNPDLVSSTSPNFATSDLAKFDAQFGLPNPPSFLKVNETGGTSYPATSPPGTGTTASWAGEADLDVEWAHAMAPDANILLVEANSGSILDLIGNPASGVGGAVDYARHAAGVSVVSMSLGIGEVNDGSTNGTETSYDQYFTTPSGHQGVTFVGATGDAGQPGDYPAYSPNVVAVGSTTLTLSGSNYGSETGFSGSGGGISTVEPKPSYQSAITLGSNRMIPDVSFDGDPQSGVPVYDSFDSQGPWIKLGGSSFATPVWASLIAIADQGRALNSNGSLDGPTQTLPKLYSLSSSDFHDITSDDTSAGNGFHSGTGYDLVTGRGTPIANKLVPDLAGFVNTASGGSISGTVFNDANGDGSEDNGEAGIVSRTVYDDANNDGILDNGEVSTTTDANGNYSFTGLGAGSYKIRQVLPSGWKQTSPSGGFGWTISLSANQAQTGKNFGTESTGVVTPPTDASISGMIFDDFNGNGSIDSGDTGLSGWTVYNDANNDGKLDNGEVSTMTNTSGDYSFTDLSAGNYKIRMVLVSGFKQTSPANGYGYTITLSANQALTGKNFGAEGSGTPPPPPTGASVSGTVFNDANGDGKLDDGEAGLSGWLVFLDLNNTGVFTASDPNTTTGTGGTYTIADLSAGPYIVRVVRPTGWTQTSPANGFGDHITLSTDETLTGILFGEKS